MLGGEPGWGVGLAVGGCDCVMNVDGGGWLVEPCC